MASVVITVTRSGHETIVTEESQDDYRLRSPGGEQVIETPSADMVFAHAVARVARAEKFDIVRLADRLIALAAVEAKSP